MFTTNLFHYLLLRSCLYHCVWSVIIAHYLIPIVSRKKEKWLNTAKIARVLVVVR